MVLLKVTKNGNMFTFSLNYCVTVGSVVERITCVPSNNQTNLKARDWMWHKSFAGYWPLN